MSRYSGAYSKLIARLDEVDAITRLASDIANSRQAIPPHSTRVRALCRSGVVLLCSHVEGYVEELASLAIIRIGEGDVPKTAMSLGFRYFLSRDLIQGIGRTEDPDAIGSKIVDFLNRDTHIWDSSIDFSPPLAADAFIGSFASPRHENIRRFFGRFGFEGFQHELALKLQADLTLCTNMVNHVVDQRNKISHGDFDTAGAPTDLQDMTRLVKLYCRTTDEIVCDWFRERGCTIRSA